MAARLEAGCKLCNKKSRKKFQQFIETIFAALRRWSLKYKEVCRVRIFCEDFLNCGAQRFRIRAPFERNYSARSIWRNMAPGAIVSARSDTAGISQ
jgi:hypothetical protein